MSSSCVLWTCLVLMFDCFSLWVTDLPQVLRACYTTKHTCTHNPKCCVFPEIHRSIKLDLTIHFWVNCPFKHHFSCSGGQGCTWGVFSKWDHIHCVLPEKEREKGLITWSNMCLLGVGCAVTMTLSGLRKHCIPAKSLCTQRVRLMLPDYREETCGSSQWKGSM